jgi:hypothetical protein
MTSCLLRRVSLISPVSGSPGQLAPKGEHASFADAQEYDREYRPPNVKRDHMWLFEL